MCMKNLKIRWIVSYWEYASIWTKFRSSNLAGSKSALRRTTTSRALSDHFRIVQFSRVSAVWRWIFETAYLSNCFRCSPFVAAGSCWCLLVSAGVWLTCSANRAASWLTIRELQLAHCAVHRLLIETRCFEQATLITLHKITIQTRCPPDNKKDKGALNWETIS